MRFDIAVRCLLAVAAVLPLHACSDKAAPPAAPRVVAVVSPQPLDAMVGETYPGTVRARVETPLSFRVPGKIALRKVNVGEHVRKGMVLAVLDPDDARLNLDAARADYSLAESELIRFRNLKKKAYVSQSQLDAAESQFRLAKARLALAENQSAYTNLVADADGTVVEIQAEAGQVVAAGQPVLGFARDGEREALIAVPEGAAVETLRKAGKLHIALWAVPGKIYEGRLRELAASADPRTRTHEARVTFVAPDDSVKLGMTANVLVGNGASEGAFRLPPSALAEVQGKASVWVVKPGQPATAQPVQVQVLQYLNEAVVVSGPLKAGDKLISAGVHLLTPGMPVQPIDRAAPVAL